ncbi:hypothetical protein B7463_g5125, partial [Scytalidium lignicola]
MKTEVMTAKYLGLRGTRLVQFMIATIVAPTYFLLGYNNAVFGGLLTLESFVKTFPRIDTVHTTGSTQAENARIQGTVTALYTVGCMFGALACFKLGDNLGRIRTTAVGCVLQILDSVLLSSSYSLGQLIVGRLVLGLGMGAATATVPVWQSESSPARNRGALVVLQGAFASLGLSISQWIDLGLFFAKGSVSWRFPLAVPILPCLMLLSVILFLPDSPRWLLKKGRIEEAIALMAVLEDLPADSAIVAEDIRKMQISLAETGKGSFRGLLHNGEERLLNRALLAMFSTFSQQMNGIGIIGFYTTTLYEQYIGLDSLVSRILSGVLFLFQLCCNFICVFTIDRIGRRKLMMFGTTGIGLCFIVLAGTVSHAQESKACADVAVVCVFLITLFFAVGAHGINYLYGTEIAPLAYRVPIYALTTGSLWAFNFLVVEVTPVGFTNLGYKFFIVFAAINLVLLTPDMRSLA